MKLLQRLTKPFRDSPTYGRDRASLFSGLTIGLTASVLNVAILMMISPFMLAPNDRDFREITQNIEFGQLLSLILLGGATVLATVLIPLRIVNVFWGPRIGRYFDQIVLSGISPFRFVIGKVTSQNLFLSLILFLLLPYFLLCLTLGGISPTHFLCGLFLVWLHCMMMALLTTWAAIYMNELIAAALVIVGTLFVGGFGLVPIPITIFAFTPTPALVYPVFAGISNLNGQLVQDYATVFLSCLGGMSFLCLTALAAISLGPLYGIVRDNSTFGEVVRPGDARLKRWFRVRHHIQRPSELAFFYENRSARLASCEGLLRWGGGLLAMLALAVLAYGTFGYIVVHFITPRLNQMGRWWMIELYTAQLTITGVGLVIAICLFAHARNTMYLRVPVAFGRTAGVTTLNLIAVSICFVSFAATSAVLPWAYETYVLAPTGLTLFDGQTQPGFSQSVTFLRLAVEGPVVLLVSGIVLYAIQHLICHTVWLRINAVLSTAALYFVGFVMVPLIAAANYSDIPGLLQWPLLYEWIPTLVMASPAAVFMNMFDELGPRFPTGLSSWPFYVAHTAVFAFVLLRIRFVAPKVKATYLAGPAKGTI